MLATRPPRFLKAKMLQEAPGLHYNDPSICLQFARSLAIWFGWLWLAGSGWLALVWLWLAGSGLAGSGWLWFGWLWLWLAGSSLALVWLWLWFGSGWLALVWLALQSTWKPANGRVTAALVAPEVHIGKPFSFCLGVPRTFHFH